MSRCHGGRPSRRVAAGTLSCLLAGASLVVLAGAAHAADADADASAAAPTNVGAVVVTAAPREEVAARAVEQAAPNVVRIQSAETILKYPDFNAAEALGRMPDISLSSDTGEGRFVQIRGIDANLDGATYGGVPLLNTNPGGTESGGGGRAVEFDTIPTGAIDGIVVTLTGLPDHEAEGLGGSIDLTPRTAANIERPFLDLSLGGGYEPLHAHGGPYDGEIALGGRFGLGDHGLAPRNGQDLVPRAGFISNPAPFSFVLTASVREDRRAVDDLEESYIDAAGAPSNAVSQYDLRRYDYHRVRFGYGGELDFQPNDDHRWYFRADIAGYQEAVNKNFLLFTNMDEVFNNTGAVPVDPNNPNGFLVTTTPRITLTNEQETHRNQIYVLGGVDRFGDLTLDYRAAYSRATFDESRNIGAQFSGPDVPFTYDNLTTPNFPIFSFPTGFDVDNAANYTSSGLGNEYDVDVDEEWSYAANAAIPVHLFQSPSDQVKLGVEARLRDKVAREFDDGFSPPPLSLAGLSFPAITYYDGHYSNGPQIDPYAIRDLIESPASNGTGFVFNPTSYFDATENIYAGYAEYSGQWGQLGLLAGVRVEATVARYGGFVETTNPDGSTVDAFQRRPVDYTNAFPTVQLKWTFTPDIVARATYSTGIARPGFEQNTTAASVDRTASPILITRGNPGLQPTLGQNFDLDLEAYLPQGGIAEIGLFDKEFTNYIVPRIQNGVKTDPLAPGQLADVTTFLNIPSAWARGIDLAYHQKFIFLPRPFDGLGLEANLTLVDSEIIEYQANQSLTGQVERGLLPGTSPVTWNLAGFYEAYGFDLRLAAEYVSHSLFGLGGDKSLDVIQDDRLTLDFTSAYRIDATWQVYFNAKNLLNTPLRYYEGEADRPIQREFYDATFEAGVRAHF
jgi:TonB-dependent receptor